MPSAPIVRRSDLDRIAVIELDHPDHRVNVVDQALLDALASVVREALGDDAVDGIVLASAKKDFGFGADIGWLPELAAASDAADILARVHTFMLELVGAQKPVVGAVCGNALGGALEVALGCTSLVAAADARIGLPEVKLGLMPGGGGTQLLSRFVDVATAAELLTTGRTLAAEEARAAGLVDLVVPGDDLRRAAVEHARTLASSGRRRSDVRGTADDVRQRREELVGSRSGLSAAAAGILEVLEAGVVGGVETGLAAERQGFLALLRSPEARAAIHLFVIESDVRRRSSAVEGGGVERLAVVGGGQMGAGIAATAVARGLTATIRDLEEASLVRASDYLDAALSRTRDTPEREAARGRWTSTTQWDGFDRADAVVEAVFELPELKRQVLADVSARVAPDALIATNTSAISIDDLAGAVTHSERFVGMHFFSPVERMPLVELIAHARTSSATTSRAAALGRRMGKVPIIVASRPGFFTSRVYARWLIEGVRLLRSGMGVAEIDRAAKDAGFPVGPLQAHDEATLELVLDASIRQVAERIMTDRLDVAQVSATLQALVDAGVRGRRHGAGFYAYDDNGRRVGANETVRSVIGGAEGEVSAEEAGERLLMAFATECFLCWDDGTLCHPDDGDIAAVLGIGFPRALGGPFHWADEVGASTVLSWSERLGSHAFPAGASLERLAASGGHFHDEERRAAPRTDADPAEAGR